ncbi:MAG TPA: GlxA family transcriptional regulator [Steroidobacteraceae bacterium]|nr:GlxA family transcriptional regulator [Steroidobacteraceae bacterium]
MAAAKRQTTRAIGLLLYDGMQSLDLAGPLDVFGSANGHAATAQRAYSLHTIGLGPQAVRAENGLALTPDFALSNAPPLDTLIIPGGVASRHALGRDATLHRWLRRREQTTRRMVSICTGVFVLASAGLIAGRRATTHWRYAEEFRNRFPDVNLDADQLFVQDGKFFSSGGLTAGMDLALSLVDADLGPGVALAVARDLVMYIKRPGNQAQFSAPLDAQVRGAGRFAHLVEWMLERLRQDLGVARLAGQANMSPRNFQRVFRQEFSTTPARYVERLRLERACILLSTGTQSVTSIAAACGFNDADVFRRAFHSIYGTSPREYRQRFSR